MQLAKSIVRECLRHFSGKTFLAVALLSCSLGAAAQDNSPYSRYGMGDLSPATNISTRGMGSISAGYSDVLSINFNNPASYSQFQTYIEERSKKLSAGRVILDVGLDFTNRTLIKPNTPQRSTSSDAIFSYVQLGMPIKKNWGLSFGLRPVSRIGYRIDHSERLYDPITHNPIDSAITEFRGTGGSYLPSIGTGFGFGLGKSENNARKDSSFISFGVNVGYLFGSREAQTLRSLINDTVLYYSSDHSTTYSFGSLFFNTGFQYHHTHINKIKKRITTIRIGAAGNWDEKLNATQSELRQTFTRNSAGEELQIDSVYQNLGQKGDIIFPANYRTGFSIQRVNEDNSGWVFGADYSIGKWSHYRFFGQLDSVQDNWQVNAGAQFYPRPKSNYFSRAVYRFGFKLGPDYIKVGSDLPTYGVSVGMGLPFGRYNALSRNQYTMLNLAIEYDKRGNNQNLLKENLVRVSVGFNFSDLWFGKKRYE